MKIVSHYKELYRTQEDSIFDNLNAYSEEQKKKILEYMKKGKNAGVRCSAVYDHVEDFSTGETVHLLTDGDFTWSTEEIYHVEKYGMRLDPEFEKKVFI